MAGHTFATLVLLLTLIRTTEADCAPTVFSGNTTDEYLCKNISEFPKDIRPNTVVLRIEKSVLNHSAFEDIVVPRSVEQIIISASVLKGLDFETMTLPKSVKQFKIKRSNIQRIGVFKENNYLTILEISDNDNLTIEPGAFDHLHKLIHLGLQGNQLDSIPVFNRPLNLDELDLKDNNIKDVKKEQLSNLPRLQKLFLHENKFSCLRNGMFSKNNAIEELHWSDNPIKSIDETAFENLTSLESLYLNGVEIKYLPTSGLKNLKSLYLDRVSTLRTIPEGLDSLQSVQLAEDKSFLCCKLIFDKLNINNGPRTLIPYTPTSPGYVHTIVVAPTSIISTPQRNRSTRSQLTGVPTGFLPGLGKRKKRVITFPLTGTTPGISDPVIGPGTPRPLICKPKPTAFQPCENIMGADWLTGVSFIVAPFALCGNFVVIVVFLCLARNYNVSRFLVTNLAIADMCMGVYLLSLVIESVITSGEYYQHVERFQFGLSCKVLGFLAMFSSELSVFALTLITVERYLTIVYAMYPKRRLTMRTAIICMAFGWAVAFTIGILPVLGVGSYGKVAICLPFEVSNGGDLYLLFVFGINGVSFIFITALYAQIYKSVFKTNNSTPTRGHDTRVARRMALLVFTDFACFAPIAITGLSALLGDALIDVKQSKYLLVFFFPLNGLLNPFLYAIITKAFRRDLATLLKNCFVCGGTLTNYLSTFPGRSVQSTNDVLSRSARPSFDMNAMDFTHSLGNIRGSRENPVSASFSKSEPNLVKFSQEA